MAYRHIERAIFALVSHVMYHQSSAYLNEVRSPSPTAGSEPTASFSTASLPGSQRANCVPSARLLEFWDESWLTLLLCDTSHAYHHADMGA